MSFKKVVQRYGFFVTYANILEKFLRIYSFFCNFAAKWPVLANIELCGYWFCLTFLRIPRKTGRSMHYSARNSWWMALRCFSLVYIYGIVQVRRTQMYILRVSRSGCLLSARLEYCGLLINSLVICRYLSVAKRYKLISLCNSWSYFRIQKVIYKLKKQYSKVLLFLILKQCLTCCV